MRFKFLVILFVSMLFCDLSYACPLRMGNIILKDSNFDCLNVSGKLDLSNSSVVGNTDVLGKMDASNVNLNILNLTGRIDASNVNLNILNVTGTCVLSGDSNHVEGTVNMEGLLIASNTVFNKNISIKTSLIRFSKNTHTASIYVIKNSSIHEEDAYIYADNSIINGDITFENGRGKVVLSNGGKVTGNVTGGIIINN